MRSIHTIGIDLLLGRDGRRVEVRERTLAARPSREIRDVTLALAPAGPDTQLHRKFDRSIDGVAEMLERLSRIEPPSKAWEAGQNPCE
jgi:hypothetical protein